MLTIEEIELMDREAEQAFKDAVAEVYAELERSGETFPYLLGGKVVHITTAQLRALKQQAAATQQQNQPRLKTR